MCSFPALCSYVVKKLSAIKKTILIFYDYFLPGFKAGGPVQSLANLIIALQDEYQFFVITSAYDLGAVVPYATIQTNQWNSLLIGDNKIQTWYADSKINYTAYAEIIKSIETDFVFFNCMYSYRFFLYPLLNKKKLFKGHTKFIISPRGILRPGSLAVKSGKKKVYLFLLKQIMLLRNCSWHATGMEEVKAIQKYFGRKVSIYNLSNIPKVPLITIQRTNKKEKVLKLVHLSLIAPVKNIKTLIQVLVECKQCILLDIYGPVKDENYWQDCKQALLLLPANITVVYKGDLQPNNVQQTLQEYDSLISLTAGENFGHALFESLSVGRPIITSYFTPWNNLEEKHAGWNVDINNKDSISNLLEELAAKTNEEWQLYCNAAHELAVGYFEEQNFKESYQKLFS